MAKTKRAKLNSLQVQIGGKHYKGKGIEPVEYNHANGLSYNLGSTVKYVTRHTDKNGVEDLQKAIHYIQMELEMVYGVKCDVRYR